MAPARRQRFETVLIAGHKGVVAAIVPFDPAAVWGAPPTPLDARRGGWLVAGTLNGVAFEGWIGDRWGRFFLMVDPALRQVAGVGAGDPVELAIRPTKRPSALAIAQEQAKRTTAPGGRSAKRKRPV